eukprot:GFKZ01002864.1.p2 GENE.GFKZ01002864.1~~GFKZ01002864.1.p2  ORF type:complete len:169 (+),score=19.63 GFKZ01002864.1:265-771(+)
MSKQRDALFRRAFALHESPPSIPTLQQALALYEQASATSNPTFPLLFNTAAICHTLSDLDPSQSSTYLSAAANHIQNALSLVPNNLEALTAAAAIHDSLARHASTPAVAHSHRAHAVHFLKIGRDAEPTDPSVRILLAVRPHLSPDQDHPIPACPVLRILTPTAPELP